MKFSRNHNIIKILFLLFYVFVSSLALSSKTKGFSPKAHSTDFSDNGIGISKTTKNTNRSRDTFSESDSNSNTTTVAFTSTFVRNDTSTGIIQNENPSTEAGIILVPTWIKKQRATKVLEKPLESQLVHFHEQAIRADDREKLENLLPLSSPSSSSRQSLGNATTSLLTRLIRTSTQTTSREIPSVRRAIAGVQRKDNTLIPFVHRRRLKTKGPIRKQEQDIDLISLVAEAPLEQPPPPPPSSDGVEFTSVVSPVEASFGGLTGLQGLPPLSFIQFVKILVALTPFLIPIIFIPLLLFTLGILMIPVTRSNIFVDVGDLRRSSGSHDEMGNQTKSLLSSYFLSPAKKFTGNVVMPRAYQFANQFIEHEECVERISCEISQRYLPYSEWKGSWRSIANRSWISKIITYLGKDRPTLLRIARSLYGNLGEKKRQDEDESSHNEKKFGRTTGGNATAATTSTVKEDKDTNKVSEISGNRRKRESVEHVRAQEHERSFINGSACYKYACEPKTFLRRLFS